MSWFTVGEIGVWLGFAAGLGVVLGWLLHEIWNRWQRAEASPSAMTQTAKTPTVPDVVEAPQTPEAATIKGNAKSMIYHVPGSPSYERTRADVWFTSEDEARAAGYRKPKNQ